MDADGREFTYDAENKQVEIEKGSSQLIGQYRFDGDGKRVKKVVPNGETTISVYDAGGRLIGEYSTEVRPSQDAKTQYLTAVHLGTPRINTNGVGAVVSRSEYSTVVQTGTNAKTVYTTNDHLGSPRINTDGTGQVISRHDYHPFGEEIAARTGSDTIRGTCCSNSRFGLR